MSTELTIAIAVVVAVVVVVAFLKIRASFKKADVAEDFLIAPETTSEHTITVDESQAAVQASETISVVADAATTEVTGEAAPAVEAAPTVEEAPAPVEESAPAETSTIKEALDVVVTQITPEEPKTVEPAAETVTETVTEEPKPTKAKKASTKKTTKKSTKKTDKKTEKKQSKKDANLANFIDTISKSSEKKTRGRKKKTDDVKIIVTAPLGKSKASKKKKKA